MNSSSSTPNASETSDTHENPVVSSSETLDQNTPFDAFSSADDASIADHSSESKFEGTASKVARSDVAPSEFVAPVTNQDEVLEGARLKAEQRAEMKRIGKSRGTKRLIFALVVIVAALVFVQYKREKERQWRWASIPMPDRTATVPEDWTVVKLGEALERSGKVRHSGTFVEAAGLAKLERATAGEYELPARATPLELAQIFAKPPTIFKVTFPEGFTCRQIAERLKARNFKSADELRVMAYPPDKDVSPQEGYWFPATYELSIDADAKTLAHQLRTRFRQSLDALPKPYPVGADKKRLTESELVTLASIVERETSVPEERALVAGVLLNRLRKGMRLQCDATVQYARQVAKARGTLNEGRKKRLSIADTRIDSIYNTYKIKGLPPAPICNPGEAALLAAARPKNSDYFFYVMSPAQGKHRFAKTFEEHSRNVRLYRQELKAQ